MIFKNKVGLGTSILGMKPEFRDYQTSILDSAIDIGYRLFDTGETYSDGVSETMIGDAIARSRIDREHFEIVTKMHPARKEDIACQASLDRLKTNYIDAYLIHFLLDQHKNFHKMTLFIEELVKLKHRGLIKNYGFSNFNIEQSVMWREAEEALGLPDEDRAKVYQYQYSLIKRKADVRQHTLIKEWGMTAMPHSPFGGGRASGSSRPPQTGHHGDFWELESIRALTPIAESVGCTVPQLMLAFLNRQPNSVIFPRSFKAEHLTDNLNSQDFIPKITKSVYDQIEALFPIGDVDTQWGDGQKQKAIDVIRNELPE